MTFNILEGIISSGLDVEQEFKDVFVRLRKRREDSDYEPDFTPREDETDRPPADAERFVARMEAFLRTHGAFDT